MTSKGYINDFYRQFEKLNDNLEKATNTISKMSLELSLTKDEIKSLKKEVEKLNKEKQELLLEMKTTKEKYQQENIDKIPKKEYETFKRKYLEILEEAKEERKKDLLNNPYKKEEINLINRLIKYCDNHLLFLKKFFVPFSNNRTESDLRGIKIKQKIG